jgi:serine/threonine-protein kinase HipA
VTVLTVLLDGLPCGHIEQSSGGNLTFTYDEAYRRGSAPTPLSLSMPLSAAEHRKRVVLPFLQGLLPDSDDALRALGRRFDVNPANPFALLRYVGSEAAGAVQIVEGDGAGSDSSDRRRATVPVTEADVARMLAHVVAEYQEGVSDDDAVGRFSLAGAQPKIALHRAADGSWSVPVDGTPTTHILKPVAGVVRRIDVVEQLTMRAAALLGNVVAPSALEQVGPWDVFVTERYDRRLVGDRLIRLHQEDLCQALAVSPAKKYQHRDGGPGLADVARLVRSLPDEVDRVAVGHDFYRAFVFNVVVAGTDAHAKNYSILLDGRRVRLAPLYDLISFAPYWNGTSRLDSAMSVGGEYSLSRIELSALVAAGSSLGVTTGDAAAIVDDVRRRVVEAFEAALAELPQALAESSVAGDVVESVMRLPLISR